MKIGVIGTIWLDTPPKGYGGTEEVVYNLVNGLVDQGHDVTLFGPKTAQVKAKVFPTVDKPLREQNIDWTNIAYTLFHITEAFDKAARFDVLHIHVNKSQDYIALPLAKLSKTPCLFTLHFKLPEETQGRYRLLKKYKSLPFTSISNSQQKPMDLNYIATVYNALRLESFQYREKPEDYFVWLGKVNPLKGTKEAILAAKKAGVKLLVLGAVDRGMENMLNYYEKEIKPLIDGKQIIWKGEVNIQEKAEILGNAKAFLNPILWEEPFGLVMAEAQATGTPVISFNRGAAPEVIVDGETGFLVETLDQMVAKMSEVTKLSRRACRENIEKRFTINSMIEAYLKAYKITISHWDEYLKELAHNPS